MNQNKYILFITGSILHVHDKINKNEFCSRYPREPHCDLRLYIQNSRLEKHSRLLNYEYYNVIFYYIEKILLKYKINTTFYTTYSLNRKNETLEINGNKYVIYDQYLGKSFNLFNKAFLQIKDSEILDNYCIRYLVESFRIMGMSIEASIFYSIGLQTNAFEKLNLAYSTKSECTAYTFIQETFIILHEIAHIIIKQNPRLISYKKREIDQYIDKQPFSLFNNLDKADKLIGNFNLDEFRRKNLIEEIICDYIATKYTFELFFNNELLTAEEFAEAIYLGLRTMRSINLLNGIISTYVKRPNERKSHNLSQLFRESSIRYWLIKDSIRSQYRSKYKTKFKEDPLHNLLLKDMHDYDSFYETPFLNVQTILKKLSATLKKHNSLKNIPFSQQISVLNEIDHMLGWR